MKKSTIWLLTIVMALTFGALLYIQIIYMENMVKMRNEQFSESVMQSLNLTAEYLEQQETLHFLMKDASEIEATLLGESDAWNAQESAFAAGIPGVLPDSGSMTLQRPAGFVDTQGQTSPVAGMMAFPGATQDIAQRYREMNDIIRSRYLYQKSLLNEVILTILRESGSRSAIERADSTMIRHSFSTELAAHGLNVPFEFAVTTEGGSIVYSTPGFTASDKNEVYSHILFPNSNQNYQLKVEFPTKTDYIFSSVRFVIPSMAFTLILLAIFIYTIVLAFRQKKLTEMKTDFINNMTHELKTPISTISLAGQMLSDPSVLKSPSTLKHLSDVITFESKRLRFQVDKVLQLSMLDRTNSALKFSSVDANKVIETVVNTFRIKVEKYGGKLECNLDAKNSEVYVDEMQFTNVMFNLLENAVKYMRDEVEPELEIATKNVGGYLQIRVKDNGIGIRKEDQKRIFEKFYRVPTGNVHNVKGFGLGLAYVKKMVALFGGTIGVESEIGVGSTFIIDLPVEHQE